MGVNTERLDEAENCRFVLITDQYFWQKIVVLVVVVSVWIKVLNCFLVISKDAILNQQLFLWDLWERGKTIKRVYEKELRLEAKAEPTWPQHQLERVIKAGPKEVRSQLRVLWDDTRLPNLPAG